MTREQILGALGRAYTHEGHTHKPVDVDLCVVMAEELQSVLAAQQPMPVPDTCWVCPVDLCTSANKLHDAWEIKKCRDMWQRLLVHFGRG